METSILTIIITAILAPLITVLTLWVRGSFDREKRRDARDDKTIASLQEQIIALDKRVSEKEREIREIRVELKNRDVEYLALYKEHTTIRAKYEVLQADYDELKIQHTLVADELTALKNDIKIKAEKAAADMQKI